MNDKASEALQNALNQREFCMMTGLWKGPVWLSPGTLNTTKSPFFWQPYARFKTAINEKARSLDSQVWTTQGKNVTVHVFDGGIRFPELCPVTLGPVDRYDIVEVPIGRTAVRGQTNTNPERARRIGIAIGCDRYWYALPFSENHGVKDRAIHFHIAPDGKLMILMRNKDYAIQFGRSMGLKGVWFSAKHILKNIIGVGLLIVLSLAGCVLAVNLLSKPPKINFSLWTGLGLFFILAGLIYGIVLIYKGSKGEPLIQE
jgi:hypothetical protein